MQKTILRIFWWTVTVLYILFIYATLGVAPAIWNKLNRFLGGQGVLAQYIIYALIGFLVFIYIIFIKKERSIARYFLFFFFVTMFSILIKLAKHPAEKIHLAEYGLLGILLYNALKIEFGRFSKNIYLCGLSICLVVGMIDEVIQWVLPNRFFAWQDVFINGTSGVTTLLMIRFNILRKKKS